MGMIVFFLYVLIFFRISMEKDWIVVLYGNDSSHLATVNANVRTIDQVIFDYDCYDDNDDDDGDDDASVQSRCQNHRSGEDALKQIHCHLFHHVS